MYYINEFFQREGHLDTHQVTKNDTFPVEQVNAVVQDVDVLDGGHGEVETVRYAQGEGRADTHSAQQAPDHNVHNQSSSSELGDRLCVLPVHFKVLMYLSYAATSVSSLLHLSNCLAAGRLSGMGLSSTWNRWDTLSEYWEEVGLHVFMQ